MHDVTFILEQNDIDLIRSCIEKKSFVAAAYLLDRPYIIELITSQQQSDIAVLRKELADAISRSGCAC